MGGVRANTEIQGGPQQHEALDVAQGRGSGEGGREGAHRLPEGEEDDGLDADKFQKRLCWLQLVVHRDVEPHEAIHRPALLTTAATTRGGCSVGGSGD